MDNLRSLHDLRRYWDGLVLGKPVSPGRIAPDTAAFLQRLHTLPDGQPDPTYATDLREKLMHATTFPLAAQSAPSPNGRTISQPVGLPLTLPGPRQRGRSWPLAQAALVLLIIAAMVITYFVALRPHGEPNFAPAVGTPVPAGNTDDWSMYKANPARSGAVNGSGPDGQPVTGWIYQAGGSAARSPAVADGVVYLQTGDGLVTALDAPTGAVLWQNADTGTTENTPAVAQGSLYLVTPAGELVALDTTTGAELWRFGNTLNPECMPAVLDGVVYMGSDDGKVYAIDAVSGEALWESTISGPDWRSLAIGGGMIFAGTGNGHLDALDLATGKMRWQFSGDDDTQTIGTPTYADGVVYANYAGSMIAFDAATGTQHWTKTFEGSRPATVANGMIFTGGLDGTVYAIDAATGDDRWTFPTGDEIQASPALVDGVLYVASFDQTLYALDAATGSERWSFDLDGAAVFGPSIAGRAIYVGTDEGTLYALGGSGTAQLAAPQDVSPSASAATPADGTAATTSTTQGIVNGEGPAIDSVSYVMSTEDQDHPIRNTGGVAVAPDGTLYVIDILNNLVHVFNHDGTPRAVWGGRGDGPGEFQFNQGDYGFGDVKVGPDGSVYTLERQGARVQKFTPDGTFVATWGERGTDPGQFQDPNTLTITPDGNIMVTDTGNARIQVFDQDGNLLRVWGESGTAPGKLRAPWEAVVRPNGTILVGDVGLQVFAFDQDGLFLGTAVEGDPSNDAPDSTYGLDVDATGNIYLYDFLNSRLSILAPDLTPLAAWGAEGTGEGEFQGLNDIALDHQGRLYASDEAGNRVQVFQIGPPIFGGAGATPTP
ncbi:MAG: PQQ-binding-like beta-propeller repeat protein [Thermomicrobiales bacterium]|nr:PQQ-binding-like beta-propeller repeat protein [Thermomicrobiales bacterium]